MTDKNRKNDLPKEDMPVPPEAEPGKKDPRGEDMPLPPDIGPVKKKKDALKALKR